MATQLKKLYLYVNAFSDLGMYMDTIMLNIVILQLTGSAAWLSAILGARVLGGLLSSLLAGVLADRFERRKLMITADVIRFLTLLPLILFANPVLILVACLLIGFFTAIFQVSFNADIPRVYGQERVLQTNVLIQRLSSAAMIAGFLGASLIGKYVGYQAALSIDATSYLLSAGVLLLLRLQAPLAATAAAEVAATVQQKSGVLQKLAGDFRVVRQYLLQHPLLLIAYCVCLTEVFGSSAYTVGIPLLAARISPDDNTLLYGFLWAAFGGGIILATMFIPKLKRVKDNLFFSYGISAVLMSSCCMLFMSNTRLGIVFPFAFATGLFDAGILTFYTTIMQLADDQVRGRVFGISSLVNRLGYVLGFLIIPLLLERIDYTRVIWTFQGLLMIVAITAMVVVKRRQLTQPKS